MAIAVVQVRDLFSAAMLFSIYSLLSAGLFVVLDAGDVALTSYPWESHGAIQALRESVSSAVNMPPSSSSYKETISSK